MYPSVMMQTHGTVPFLPYRHMPATLVPATVGGVHVPPRPALANPGRPPVVTHHIKQAGVTSQLHTIPLPVHPTTLQQTRSPSPKLIQHESTASELSKGMLFTITVPEK